MDMIHIKGLEVYGYHGVFEEERKLGQRFVLDLVLSLSLRKAGMTDALCETVDYGALCHEVQDFFVKNRFHLIETCGERLVEHIFFKYDTVETVKIEIKKPWAPIGLPLKYVSALIERSRHRAYVAFGSNLGDREENIKKAMALLESDNRSEVAKCSSFYETEPVGYAGQGDFLNGVLALDTLLSPRELLQTLMGIEEKLKRVRAIKNGPRTIDLDILLYDGEVISEDDLVVPHPRMHQRRFVLEPFCEIAPHALHPLLKKRMASLLAALGEEK